MYVFMRNDYAKLMFIDLKKFIEKGVVDQLAYKSISYIYGIFEEVSKKRILHHPLESTLFD